MKEIMEYLKVRYCNENGQGIVEYALILAFVVAIATYVGGDGTLTTKISTVFQNVTNAFGK
ncbi:Flp family type IVb pilin [Selenomonas ruminantium]|uniref:Pilus assembly protein Flp/PilA n=1 Tax=Selenomonas ruminantium TaxID=971 RepID=A0A1H0MDQ1_SELRU|nr:pilin protein [Selenomonas ruminantium]SDO78569.1 pilus assembly protein Flp/PilA [Selenomonas ruminantium]